MSREGTRAPASASRGLSGDDLLDGNEGTDIVTAGPGDDLIDGGPGDDTIDGGTEFDRIFGGEGTDIITAGDGFDTVEGNLGDDLVDAGNGVRGSWLMGSGGEVSGFGNAALLGQLAKGRLNQPIVGGVAY